MHRTLTRVIEKKGHVSKDIRLSNQFLMARRDMGVNEMRFLMLGLSKGLSDRYLVRVTHREFSDFWEISHKDCPYIFRRLSLNLARCVISLENADGWTDIPLVEKNIGIKKYSGELQVYINRNLESLFEHFSRTNPYFSSSIQNLRKFSTITGMNLYLFARAVGLRKTNEIRLPYAQFQRILGTSYKEKRFLLLKLNPVLEIMKKTDRMVQIVKAPRGYVAFRINSTGLENILAYEFGFDFGLAKKLLGELRETKEDPEYYIEECLCYCRSQISAGKVANVLLFVENTLRDFRPTASILRKRKDKKSELATADTKNAVGSRKDGMLSVKESLASLPDGTLRDLLCSLAGDPENLMSGEAGKALNGPVLEIESLPEFLLYEMNDEYERTNRVVNETKIDMPENAGKLV